MILISRFEGDNNKAIMKKQHGEYPSMVADLFNRSRLEYLRYDWYGLMDSKLSKNLISVQYYNDRMLEMSHDLIAASYRYLFYFKDESNPYPKVIDGKVYNFQSWKDYYHWENGNLSKNRKYQLPLVISVAYQNTERGYKAANELNRQLLLRYPFLDRPDSLNFDQKIELGEL